MTLPFSIFIITLNEADRIGAVLQSLQGLSDDVVVVDSGSTDDTVAIATAHGARVLVRDFDGYGMQKRFGEEACLYDWVLNLDADEVVSKSLYQEIQELFTTGEPMADGYQIPISETFPGEDVPHRFAYTLRPVRLYRLSRGRYNPSPIHDRVDMVSDARIGVLSGRVYHYSVRSLGDQIAKLNAYSDRQAVDFVARGKRMSHFRLYVEFPLAFLKAYILRRHILRGTYGFLTAMNYAFSRHLRLAKIFEAQRLKGLE